MTIKEIFRYKDASGKILIPPELIEKVSQFETKIQNLARDNNCPEIISEFSKVMDMQLENGFVNGFRSGVQLAAEFMTKQHKKGE